MRRIAYTLLAVSIAVSTACVDRGPAGLTSPGNTPTIRFNAELEACPSLTPQQTIDAINEIFGLGSPDANAALGKWDNIQKHKAAGRLDEVVSKTWDLVDFMLVKQNANKLPVSDTFTTLVRHLFCNAGIDAGMPDGSKAAVVYPNVPFLVVTDDFQAGIEGVDDEFSIVSITPSNDTLNTDLDKYNVKVQGVEYPTYVFSKFPSNVFPQPATVGVCAIAPESVLDDLVLGHNIGGSGFELLPAADVTFLACSSTASIAPQTMGDRLLAMALPKFLHAQKVGASGVGGSVLELSPIGPVNPNITVTKNAAGTSAPIGSYVTPVPMVTLSTPNGKQLSGIPVTFAIVSGGGMILPATAVNTDSDGIASSSSWKLGLTPGENVASATPGLGGPAVEGVVMEAVTFTATATPPVGLVIETSPAGGSYTAGSTLPTTSIRVVDADNRTVEGFSGTVTVSATPGPVSGTLSKAASAGLASFTDLVITKSGSHTLSVGSSYNGSTFSATTGSFNVTAASAHSLVVNGGDNQTAPAGATLGVSPYPAPSVLVTDVHGNPVSGQAVFWVAGGVSGDVTPTSPTTNASGIATATWSLLAGANDMIASLSATDLVPNRYHVFNATGTVSTQPFVSCGPGNQRDPIASYFVRMSGTSTKITDARFFFSVNGNAKEPTPYRMSVRATVRAGSGAESVFESAQKDVYLRGSNSEQKEANFRFPGAGIVSGNGTTVVFQIINHTATPNTISYNSGDCPPGTKCSVKPACPAVQVPTTNPFSATLYRASVGIRLFGY